MKSRSIILAICHLGIFGSPVQVAGQLFPYDRHGEIQVSETATIIFLKEHTEFFGDTETTVEIYFEPHIFEPGSGLIEWRSHCTETLFIQEFKATGKFSVIWGDTYGMTLIYVHADGCYFLYEIMKDPKTFSTATRKWGKPTCITKKT